MKTKATLMFSGIINPDLSEDLTSGVHPFEAVGEALDAGSCLPLE